MKIQTKRAMKCGPVPRIRNWRKIPIERLTRAEKVMAFIENYLKTPEGSKVGENFELIPFQEAFIYAVYDSPRAIKRAYLSIARKNGKTSLIAALLLAHIVGPEAKKNSQIASGAMSRDQAALVFKLAEKMIVLSPELQTLTKVVPSLKTIIGLSQNVEYKALSADASTNLGISPALAILDETGQVTGPTSDFVDAIVTSQGAYDDALLVVISTQAASDADLFSTLLDDAERSGDPSIVSHVYTSDPDKSMLHKNQWKNSNPALGIFRSMQDLAENLEKASRLPATEGKARNLLLNQRISLDALFVSPAVWKQNRRQPDHNLFYSEPVHIGLDLSARTDLTAAVLAAKHPETDIVHIKPYVFTPQVSLAERSLRDRAPYETWVKNALLIAVPSASVDYDWVCHFMVDELAGVQICSIQFDRWRIELFQAAAKRTGLFDVVENWNSVGQGYRDISPRLESFEALMLARRLAHGGHPLLNLGAAHAIATRDPAGNRKLDKAKTTQRIDPLVAAVMATYPLCDGEAEDEIDIDAMIG